MKFIKGMITGMIYFMPVFCAVLMQLFFLFFYIFWTSQEDCQRREERKFWYHCHL